MLTHLHYSITALHEVTSSQVLFTALSLFRVKVRQLLCCSLALGDGTWPRGVTSEVVNHLRKLGQV